MKKFSLIVTITGLLLALGVKPASAQDQIARVYFAGTQKIAGDPNSLAFANEFGCAEAKALEIQTLAKLARAPGTWFKSKMAPGAGDGAALLRPLLDDLLKSEWVFEMRQANGGSPEYALAIRLDNVRAQLWSRNLATLLQSWTGIGISADKAGGWLLRKHDPPNLFQLSRPAGWLVLDCGTDVLRLQNEILQSPELRAGAVTAPVPGATWLSANLDWPRLAQLFPALRSWDLPRTDLQVTARDGNFLINGKLGLARPLPPLENWRVPVGSLHPPFTSFTAVRGISAWLEHQAWAWPYAISPMPQQFFFWAMPKIPFQTFGAAPVADGRSALTQLDAKVSNGNNVAMPGSLLMPMHAELDHGEISFRGLPFTTPFVKLEHAPAGDFLLGGFFPNSPISLPLPPELLAQFKTPEVVYYHWENTGERLKPLPQLAQLMLLISRHRQLGGLADQWVTKVGSTLGATVTTAVQTGPQEVSFARRAPGGLTALEFFALGLWLEAPNFPGFDMQGPSGALPQNPRRMSSGPAPAQPFQLHSLH